MKDQIQEILGRYQINAAEFAKIIGVNPSGISHILSGRRNYLSIETILKIVERFPEIDLDWLILGAGDMKRNEDLKAQTELPVEPIIESPKIAEQDKEDDQTTKKEVVKENPEPIHGKYAVKIVVFYSDNTYQELNP